MSDGYLFDQSGFIEDQSFRKAEIVITLEDNWGNLWIGTWGRGVGKGDVRARQLRMLNFGLANHAVNALTFQENILWSGGVPDETFSQGITAWNFQRDMWDYYEQRNISDLRSDEVNAIAVDGRDIWFGTTHGAVRYSGNSGRWKNFDGFDGLSDDLILDIATDDSSVWVASDNGIDRIDKASIGKKDSLIVENLARTDLRTVRVNDLEMMENLLWAATDHGIYVIDTKKDLSGFADEVEGPMSNFITSISRYKNELWFGSADGIDVFDSETKEWRGVPEGRSFPNTRINRVLATEDAVWAATDEGVLKYDRASRSWRTFTVEDGLIDNRVNDILLDGDNIWFATESGITQFYWNDPHRID
jgi:ligand-binding sensor domain-containing protein